MTVAGYDVRVDTHFDALEAWVMDLDSVKVLVLGDPGEKLSGRLERLRTEVRWTDKQLGRHVPGGLLAFRGDPGDGWYVVVSLKGTPARESRQSTLSDLAYEDPLDRARDMVLELWQVAAPQRGAAQFAVGDVVRVLGSQSLGRVRRALRVEDSFEYEVDVSGQALRYPEAGLERQHGDIRDPQFWLTQPPSSAKDIARTLTWTKLRHPLTDTIYSFRTSRTLFRAYQFRPVLKIIGSDSRRLLIADEVGLGKTIEAGLVWTELEQRGDVKSALVICPSMLRFKWQDEMRNRFDRRLRILSAPDLLEWVDELERGAGQDMRGIVSLEMFRMAEVLDRLEALSPRLDLVIVDEAHTMRNVGTKSNALGALLSEWADALLFLSATPLNLHQDDLFNLLHLLDDQQFPDRGVLEEQVAPNRVINAAARLLLTEGRMRPEVVLASLRSLQDSPFGRVLAAEPDFASLTELLSLDRELSPIELARAKRHLFELHTLAPIFTRTRKIDTPERKAVRQPHDCVVQWTSQEAAYYKAVQAVFGEYARRRGHVPGFALQMPLRQAASCLPAMWDIVQKRSDLELTDEGEGSELLSLLWSESFETHSAVLMQPLVGDTKYDVFKSSLDEALTLGSGQALVFSFFRGTLAYLHQRLSKDGFRVRVMSGGTPVPERQQLMKEFRHGTFDILLSSEVGAEGLDFEFCNVLVNYDLPWNPMRVEQRIGRLDRFGQLSEKIFILNMQVPGTIETDILSRLYDRIGIFERTVGDLEPILRDFDEAVQRVLDPSLTPEQRERQILRYTVALEEQKADIDDLKDSDSLLAGLNDLLVDGFENDTPGGGRFVGSRELQELVFHYLLTTDGTYRPIQGSQGVFCISGGPRLAQALRTRNQKEGTLTSSVAIAADIEDRGCQVTFDEQEAIREQLDLVSVRHPLVGLAVDALTSDSIALARYGAARVPGLLPAEEHLVGLFLVESTGLRPSLEILSVAVDSVGNTIAGVGPQLLEALAHGRLDEPATTGAIDASSLFPVVDQERGRLLQQLDRERRAINDAQIDRRIATRSREYDLKIERAQGTLRKVQERQRQATVVRLNVARVANLRARRDEIIADLENRRNFSINSQPIAVLHVTP